MANTYWIGKERSEETKKKVSENHARFWKGKIYPKYLYETQ